MSEAAPVDLPDIADDFRRRRSQLILLGAHTADNMLSDAPFICISRPRPTLVVGGGLNLACLLPTVSSKGDVSLYRKPMADKMTLSEASLT